MEVSVDPHHERRRGDRLEAARPGPRSPTPRARSSGRGRRLTAATAAIARLRCGGRRSATPAARRGSPAAGARSGASAAAGERRVQAGDERPEVRGDLGRPLEADAPGRGDQVGEELRGPLVGVAGVGDERLEHRDRRHAASRVTTSAQPASRGTPGKRPPRRGRRSSRGPGSAPAAAPVRLEQQPAPRAPRRCSTGRGRAAFVGRRQLAGARRPTASANPGDGRQTSAASTCAPDAAALRGPAPRSSGRPRSPRRAPATPRRPRWPRGHPSRGHERTT